jgi:pyruvate kinase
MLDTKGPEIRTGYLKTRDPIEILANQKLKIVTDYQIEGDATKIACSYKALPKTVSVGSTIFIADGSLTCEVCELGEVSIIFKIQRIIFYIWCLTYLLSTLGFRHSYLQKCM